MIKRMKSVIVIVTTFLLVTSIYAGQEKQKKIACIGDSITYGIGVTDTRGTDSYPAVLQKLLGEEYRVGNYGRPGAAVQDEADMPFRSFPHYEDSKAANAELYLIMLGTNDARIEQWDAERFKEEYISLIQEYKELGENTEIYLLTSPHVYLPEEYKNASSGINTDIVDLELYPIELEVAEEANVPVIDIYQLTQAHEEWFPDGVHPDKEGYAEIAQYIYNEISRKE